MKTVRKLLNCMKRRQNKQLSTNDFLITFVNKYIESKKDVLFKVLPFVENISAQIFSI